MSIGAGPNAAGGLWMGPSAFTPIETGNSPQWLLPSDACGGSGGSDPGDSCSCAAPGAGAIGGEGGYGSATLKGRFGGGSWDHPTLRGDGGGGSCSSGAGGGGGGMLGETGSSGLVSIYRQVGVSPLPTLPVMPVCTPPAGGPVPLAVPGPDAPFSLKIKLSEDPFFGPTVRGLSLTCQETGATLTSACDYMIFNFPASGVTVKFTSPAGVGQLCTDSSSHSYIATSNSATVNSLPTFVSFQVTRV